MSLVKRGKVWYVSVARPDGTIDRHSTKTEDRKQAQEYHDRLKASYWEQQRLGAKPQRTWEEAVERYLKECEILGVAECTLRGYRMQLQWWGKRYFAGKLLSEVTKGKIMEGVYEIASTRKQSTANRYLAPLRSMLYKAAGSWEWIDQAPTRFKQFDESKFARKRALTPDEVHRVAGELPEHQREIFLFSVATGLRQANVRLLHWTWVDMGSRLLTVPAEVFKNRTQLVIPLSDAAIEVIRRQLGKHETYVFTYKGSVIKQVNTRAWRGALRRAGITDYRHHDNRHTWATMLRAAGVPLEDIQDLGGWKSEKMVRRYAAPDMQALAERAKKIDQIFSTAQTLHKPALRVVQGST